MTTEHLRLLSIAGYFFEWGGIALVLFVPLKNLYTTSRLGRAILQMWLAYFIWSAILCFLLPVTAARIFRDARAFNCFPDMAGIAVVAFAGWIPSMLVCGIAYLIMSIIGKRPNRPEGER